MARGRIYEFDPVIYPTRVWIAVSPEFRTVDRTFQFLNEDDEVMDYQKEDFDGQRYAIATTYSVVHRKSRWMGCLVVIFKPKDCNAGIMAHESGHCTDWMCDQFGVSGFSYKDGEARQYYAQWVANSIYKVLRDRV